MMPAWIEPLLAMPDRIAASLAFARAYISAPPAERAAVCSAWNFGVEWEYPSVWRLACTKGEQGSSEQRIVTTLVLHGLDLQPDFRDELMALAVVYHACVLAGLDADATFLAVAETLPEAAAESLRSFAERLPEEKSMKAFKLVVDYVAGEPQIRVNW